MFLFKRFSTHCTLALFCFGLLATSESFAQQKPYDSIVVFGGSLSDSGNAFVVLSDPSSFGFDDTCGPLTPMNVPPYNMLDDLYVPDGTYAIGGHHVSNGATWIEQLARNNALAGFTRPALRNDGQQARNYAVGGARANDYECRFNLSNQLGAFFNSSVGLTSDSLVVFEMGGNDLRDVLAGADPTSTIGGALNNIFNAIVALYNQGARQFLLMNVPDIGKTPAVQILDIYYPGLAALATNLTVSFNGELSGMQWYFNTYFPDMDVRIFDAYTLLDSIITSPDDYGIEVTDVPCVTPNVAPYKCTNPDAYLFWDGIHPTKAVHKIMAEAAAEVLSTP
ncbi:MAG: SGNH/GDSL hydrolase family protein [Gammaproteobacteria bacterium]